MPEAKRRAVRELALFGALIVAYQAVVLAELTTRWVFVAAAAVLVGYAWHTWRRGDEHWRDFGVRTDNLAAAAWPIGAFTAVGAATIVGCGVVGGRSLWRPDLAVMLPLYPIWGVVQQLLFQGVIHRRLSALIESRSITVSLTALIFALVHVGDWRLVGLTGVAGLAWSALFVRWPNVWLLGLSHGVLAALAYPLVLGDAPLARI